MAKKHDVYMPLIIGDWLKGTRGMKSSVKGVYLSLLLYQWDNGFIPESMEELNLIDPEVGSVWVSISDKFKLVEVGKLQNEKLEEVRNFFSKQQKNGKKGGRPKKENPDINPKQNPERNHHTGVDVDNGLKDDLEEEGSGETNFDQGMDIDLIVEKIILDKNYREQCEIAGYPPAKLDRWMYAFNRFLKFKGVVKNSEVHWRLGFPAWMAYHEYRNGEDPDAYSPIVWAKQKKEDADKILKVNGTAKSNSNSSATVRSVESLLSGADQ